MVKLNLPSVDETKEKEPEGVVLKENNVEMENGRNLETEKWYKVGKRNRILESVRPSMIFNCPAPIRNPPIFFYSMPTMGGILEFSREKEKHVHDNYG